MSQPLTGCERGILTRFYRALDELATYETLSRVGQATAPARYAIRQALDQEYQKYLVRQRAEAAQSRFKAGSTHDHIECSNAVDTSRVVLMAATNSKVPVLRRDFFGRVVNDDQPQYADPSEGDPGKLLVINSDKKVWVSFHEGFSNAVRKPITLAELMRGF